MNRSIPEHRRPDMTRMMEAMPEAPEASIVKIYQVRSNVSRVK